MRSSHISARPVVDSIAELDSVCTLRHLRASVEARLRALEEIARIGERPDRLTSMFFTLSLDGQGWKRLDLVGQNVVRSMHRAAVDAVQRDLAAVDRKLALILLNGPQPKVQ